MLRKSAWHRLAALALVAAALTFTACAPQQAASPAEAPRPAGAPAAAPAPAPTPAPRPAPAPAPAPPASGRDAKLEYSLTTGSGPATASLASEPMPIVPDTRKRIKNGDIEIKVNDAQAAWGDIQSRVQVLRGFVQESNLSGRQNEDRRARMVVRLPSEQFDAFMTGISGLGEVQNLRVWTEDVTEQFVDLEARLAAAKDQEIRLRELAKRAGTVEELFKVENEIARVRATIESLQGRLNVLNGRVEYSTIAITLIEPVLAAKKEPPKELTFGEKVAKAWREALATLQILTESAVLFLIAALPVLIYLGALGLLAYGLWRLARKTARPQPQPPGSSE